MCIGQESTTQEVARERWLEQRRSGIGGSDSARAVGLVPGRYRLWAEKSGLIEPEDLSDREWIRWGLRLERSVGEGFAEDTGREVEFHTPFTLLRHPERPWMIDTPDAYQYCPTRSGRGALQIKTAGQFKAAEWSDGPPVAYQVQLMHELEVTGCDWGTLAVLIGGQKLVWFDLDRHDRFIRAMVDQEAAFWELVTARRAPPVDGTEATAAALKALFPTDNGERVDLPAEADQWDTRLCELKEEIKQREAEKLLLENQLKAVIGEASIGVTPAGVAYTYNTITVNHKPQEAYTSSYRRLTRKAVK